MLPCVRIRSPPRVRVRRLLQGRSDLPCIYFILFIHFRAGQMSPFYFLFIYSIYFRAGQFIIIIIIIYLNSLQGRSNQSIYLFIIHLFNPL